MKTLTFYLMTFLALTSQAHAGGSINNLQIKEIWAGGYSDTDDNGDSDKRPITRIRLASPHANPDSCSDKKTIVIKSSLIDVENIRTVYFHQQYALALTALANGNKLGAYVYRCTTDGKFAIVDRLSITG